MRETAIPMTLLHFLDRMIQVETVRAKAEKLHVMLKGDRRMFGELFYAINKSLDISIKKLHLHLKT